MNLKKEIEKSLTRRIASEISSRSSLKFLIGAQLELYLDQAISIVYLYTRPKKGLQKASIYMTEVIAAIGHSVRSKLKQKRDSAIAAKTGAFILYTFEELKLLQIALGASSQGHNQYIIQVLNDDAICQLWSQIDTSSVEKLPSETPYAPWQSYRHETGAILVKTENKSVLEQLSVETHPIVFDTVNRAQEVGWNINKGIYDLHLWALRNRAAAFSDIWEQTNPEARTTKVREARAIGDIAKRFLNKTFYHLYYYDFRGRKYPTTAYLHEQGSDLARGLLLRADKKAIGKAGFFWLMVSIANNWAGDAGRSDKAKTDKIPLQDRYEWAVDNEDIFLSYAERPKVDQGWMKADKPWQFLAACLELMHFRIWQSKIGDFENYEYESNLEVFIDGSNNGSQHLSALTKDEITAPQVNLVPSELPGDLYKYVADYVWAAINKTVSNYSPLVKEACEKYINEITELKKQIMLAEPQSEARQDLVSKLKEFKAANIEIADRVAPVFWSKITDNKERRKVVKRNVMTLPYGGTSYGLGEQQISDAKKHGIESLYHMEHKWGAYMGREVYEICKESLKRPMQLLEVFELAGRQAELRGEFLSWKVPITNFPVVQNYVEGIPKKIWVQYGPPKGEKKSTGYYENTLQLNVCFIEDTKPSRGKQSQGASPNAIHSLDAGHLALTVHRADFYVTTIHDSFGCLLADMPKLFKLVRETFIELYKADPLSSLIKDIDGDLSTVQLGSLDISLVLDSEYCFA